MKVLHINPSLSLVRGGPSQATIDIVKALRNQGVDAEIATTNDNGFDVLDVPLCQKTEYSQVPVWFFPRFSPSNESLREFQFSYQFTTWLWQHIQDYDLVHIHAIFSYTCTAAMAIARIKNVPYIIRPNGMLCHWSLQQAALKKRFYLNIIEQANINHSRFIEFTATQEQEEADVLGLTANKFILPYGIWPSEKIRDARTRLRQMIEVSEDEPIILFLSRLHYKKGLDFLIPALGQLVNQRFTFILAGSGSPDYEAEVKEMLQTANIENRTYWAGFVQGEMKNLLLQGADIFALTSYSESFGLAVLEAISDGLTVVVTPGVPLAAVVEENQLGYVPDLKPESIIYAVSQSLLDIQDQEKQKSMRERARQFILENYTWEQIALKMIMVYQDIMKSTS